MEAAIDAHAVIAKVAARDSAEELLKLIISEAAPHGSHALELFQKLHTEIGQILRADRAAPQAPATPGYRPMSDDEARAWERRTKINFGMHKGKLIKDVPVQYLAWLDGENDFARELHRYLGAPSVARELED